MWINEPRKGAGRAGFTLVELLVVVVVIGILVAVIIPRMSSSRDHAIVAKLKADLRNLVTAQESYINDNPSSYYSGAVPSAALTYSPSIGVSITITNASSSGWSAVANAPTLTAKSCAIYLGTAPRQAPATEEGRVGCTR